MKTLSPLTACVLAVLVGFVASLARVAIGNEVGVRIRFGLMDKQAESWNGSVSVKPGKVALLSGWRFEQDDQAHGTEGWVASTRAISPAPPGAQVPPSRLRMAGL